MLNCFHHQIAGALANCYWEKGCDKHTTWGEGRKNYLPVTVTFS